MDTSLPEISQLANIDTLKVADIKDQQGQDILSISAESYSSAEEELKEIHRVSEMSMLETNTKLLPVKASDTIKQHLENSSGSESSPHIQRRRVRPASSSSEEYISGDDEEFIRRQLMHMGADENLVPSDEENQIGEETGRKEHEAQQETIELEPEDAKKSKRVLKKISVEPEKWIDNSLYSHDREDRHAQVIPVSEALEQSIVEIDVSDDNEKITADLDTATPVITQKSPVRQITEEYESLVEDSSKADGSSSVQVSSITPGTASPTSVSSIDEDSDSSPSHKKAKAESKQQRKAKHRQQGQALPTVEDSSEEDKVREDDELKEEAGEGERQQLRKVTKKSKTGDDFAIQRRRDNVTKAEKLRQPSELEERKSSSFSDFSPSIESEPETDQRECRTLSSETLEGRDVAVKPLKSAEEAYEEMMQKAQEYKTLEKRTPPDIEPLYGGMLIEDYAYETLVEEHEQAVTSLSMVTHEVAESESVRILMTPEEAYEEMMHRKREAFQKEQEAKEMDATFFPLDISDTCYVDISGNQTEKPLLQVEDAYDELLKKQKDVLTPGTSPTQSSPVSPASPLSVSESSYDSPEVILIPSSGDEDVAAEPIECILEPYITESTSTHDVKKALFPIPDLKITQCSSGEEEVDEEDSFAQETLSQESADVPQGEEILKEIAEPNLSEESFEADPFSVVCEIPSSKRVAETAGTLPVQDSAISPLSPPTSPGLSSPDSYIEAAMAPSSSPCSDQTPEPTTPASPSVVDASAAVVIHMPELVSEQATAHPAPPYVSSPEIIESPVTPASPHVLVNAPTPSEIPISKQILETKPTPAPKPSVISKPMQKTIHIETPAHTVDSAPQDSVEKPFAFEMHEPTADAKSATIEKEIVALVAAPQIEQNKTQISSQTVSVVDSFISTVAAPVIQSQETSVVVQMPSLVTAPSQSVPPVHPIAYTPIPTTVSVQVPISVPTMVSAAIPENVVSMDQTSSFQTPQPPTIYMDQSTKETIQELTPTLGKATPFVPPEPIAAKTVSVVSPTVTTTVAFGAIPSQPVQPMLVQSHPVVEEIQQKPEPAAVSPLQSVSEKISPAVQTHQGQVVIMLPNYESVPLINQTAQDVNLMAVRTTIGDGRSYPVVVSVSPLTCAATVPPLSSAVTVSAVPLTVKKPHVMSVSQERTDKPVIEFPPPPSVSPPELPYGTLPKVDLNQLMSVCTSSSVTATPEPTSGVTVKPAITPPHKSPPPVPPKPVCIPPGLVFNHRSRESVRPPISPEPIVVQAVRAATLPRTREPPKALSLSLTAPVESKHSASSPKSPLSPRFARTLETYVVITLPSEPGSPVESITTQAPMRRSSLPTPRQQVPSDASRVFPTAFVDAPVMAISAQTVAAPIKATPVIAAPALEMEPETVPITKDVSVDSAQSVVAPCMTVPVPAVSAVQTLFSEPLVIASPEVAKALTVVPCVTTDNKMHSPSALSAATYESAPVVIAPPAVVAAAPYVASDPTATTYTTPFMVSAIPMASEPAQALILSEKEVALEFVAQKTVSDVRQEPEMHQMQTTHPAPITITQIPIPTQNEDIQGLDVEEVLIVSATEEALNGLGPSPVPIPQLQEQRKQETQAVSIAPSAPITFTQFTKSIESQEIRGQDKVISSMSQVYSAISKTEQHPEKLPSLVTQVVTTEVQRTTTVSVVQERVPVEPMPEPKNASVTVQPEVHPKPKQNGRIHYPGDVIDLTTFKVNLTMTDQGMDLTAPDSSRSSLSSESIDKRQATAVQPEIVNLSAEIPTTKLSVVTDSITIVTCTATITYNNNSIVEKPLDLGNATSVPLPLTTYNPFEPLAQIVYRPVNSQPKPTTGAEIPINLSYRAVAGTAVPLMPVTVSPVSFTNGTAGTTIHIEPTGVGPVDLTTSKPMKTMVALSSSSGVVTAVVEDDGTPVDLTSGRRAVCCDVIYKLPFTGSCRTQPPVTTQPDVPSVIKEDQIVIEDLSTMKGLVSESHFKETELFGYERKNGFTYQNGAPEGAIDLTSATFSTGMTLSIFLMS